MKKPKSLLQTHRVISPPEGTNVRELSGETLVRHMQFPTTILKFMKDRQKNMFDAFMKNVDRCTTAEKMVTLIRGQYVKYESQRGCLRWHHKSVFMDDGQARFEAADDLSFDICGSFCPNCELSRRICESLPVHYSVPEENEKITAPMDGFTETRWMRHTEPDNTDAVLEDGDPRVKYWMLSAPLFRDLLAMMGSSGYLQFTNEIVHSYGCGGMRCYVASEPANMQDALKTIDITNNILNTLATLEKTHVYKSAYKINIYASEISPFIRGAGDNHVYYDETGNMCLDLRSEVIHGMSVRMTNSMGFQNVFVCPEMKTGMTMEFVKSFTEFFPDKSMYPTMYYNVPGIGILLMLIILFLSSDQASELSQMVYTDSSFMDRLGIYITSQDDIRRVRKAMLEMKVNSNYESYSDMVNICRIIIQGMNI